MKWKWNSNDNNKQNCNCTMYFSSESKRKSRAWDNDGSSEEQSLPKAKPVREPAAKKAVPGKKNAGKDAKKGQTSRVTTSRSPSVKSLEESETGELGGEYEVEKLLGALLDDDSQQWGLVSWKGTSDCFFRSVTFFLSIYLWLLLFTVRQLVYQ